VRWSRVPPASWTAPAERSVDGAFERTGTVEVSNPRRADESGVALRFAAAVQNVGRFMTQIRNCEIVEALHDLIVESAAFMPLRRLESRQR
jgi:hypothetical protein